MLRIQIYDQQSRIKEQPWIADPGSVIYRTILTGLGEAGAGAGLRRAPLLDIRLWEYTYYQ